MRLSYTPETKRTPTFIDGQYIGYLDLFELVDLESKARAATKSKIYEEEELSDVYVYAYYAYATSGEMESAHFYSGYPKTYEEYNKLSDIPRIQVKSIFNR